LEPRERFLMSQLPPCSGRPGIVRAPSLPILSAREAEAEPAWTFRSSGRSATQRVLESGEVKTSSDSLRVHSCNSSREGAQPMIPGWTNPANFTLGMWRELQKIPERSHIAVFGSAT
jgi:hypothetical protein